MGTKTFLLIPLVVGAAGALWYFKDAPSVRGATASVSASAATVATKLGYSDIASSVGNASNPTSNAGGLRKCVKGDAVSYVDTPCPPGSKEHAIRKDLVTVVPGQAPAQASSQDAAKNTAQTQQPKTVLEMLAPPEKGESLKEKMMNRAIGQ
ncbi:MAG: hypothetical protein ABL985_01620 [Casimicrobium sp.]